MTLTTILAFLLGPIAWLVISGWSLVKAVLWLCSPVWLMAAIAGAISGCRAGAHRRGCAGHWLCGHLDAAESG